MAARLAAATSVDLVSFCRWFATKAEWAIKPPSITTAVMGHAEGRGGVTLGVYSFRAVDQADAGRGRPRQASQGAPS